MLKYSKIPVWEDIPITHHSGLHLLGLYGPQQTPTYFGHLEVLESWKVIKKRFFPLLFILPIIKCQKVMRAQFFCHETFFYRIKPLVKLNTFWVLYFTVKCSKNIYFIFRWFFFQVWAPLTELKLLFWTGLLMRDLEWNFHYNLLQMITIPSAQWTGLCLILANPFWEGTKKWGLLKPWLNILEIQTLPILFCELLMLTMEKWFGIINPLLYNLVIPVI